jgi:hypothetical protein
LNITSRNHPESLEMGLKMNFLEKKTKIIKTAFGIYPNRELAQVMGGSGKEGPMPGIPSAGVLNLPTIDQKWLTQHPLPPSTQYPLGPIVHPPATRINVSASGPSPSNISASISAQKGSITFGGIAFDHPSPYVGSGMAGFIGVKF